ncbi:MAG TPA: hypothetical protein VGJ05_14650 [Fimbriiglobus sp.]
MTVSFPSNMILSGGGAKTARKQPTWSDQVWELYERTTGKARPEFFAQHAPSTRHRNGTMS